MATQLSDELRNARADANTAKVGNAGLLKIYAGAVPANVAAGVGTLLSTHTLGTPFAPAASGGVLSPTVPADATAVASGLATYYRVTTSGGTHHIQGTVGEGGSGADLILNDTDVVSGGPVHIISWTYTEAGA